MTVYEIMIGEYEEQHSLGLYRTMAGAEAALAEWIARERAICNQLNEEEKSRPWPRTVFNPEPSRIVERWVNA